MIIDTSILNTKYYHSIRGAIDFGDRIKDSQEEFSPWNVDREITLDFEIVFNIPKEVRMKSLEHLLERARKETDLKRLKEIEKAYNSLVNVTVHDEWIGRCKEILGINN